MLAVNQKKGQRKILQKTLAAHPDSEIGGEKGGGEKKEKRNSLDKRFYLGGSQKNGWQKGRRKEEGTSTALLTGKKGKAGFGGAEKTYVSKTFLQTHTKEKLPFRSKSP